MVVGITADDPDLFENLKTAAETALAGQAVEVGRRAEEAGQHFHASIGEDGEYLLLLNGKRRASDKLRDRFVATFNPYVRIAVAEHAKSHVFLHAGAVARKGWGIVIPGFSFSGKTTLVADLVRQGAEYFSDEFAVLDSQGNLLEFPRELSVRYLDGHQKERSVSVKEFGGEVGRGPVPVGLVLLTEYKEGVEWKPRRLTRGEGMLGVIPHTIPLQASTDFALAAVNRMLERATVVKGSRGNSQTTAKLVLDFFDNLNL